MVKIPHCLANWHTDGNYATVCPAPQKKSIVFKYFPNFCLYGCSIGLYEVENAFFVKLFKCIGDESMDLIEKHCFYMNHFLYGYLFQIKENRIVGVYCD
jgi:hypothetical protein